MIFENKVVMICDGTADAHNKSYSIDQMQLPKNPIPVLLDFDEKRRIGSSIIKKDGNNLVAEIVITDTQVQEAIKKGMTYTPATGMVCSAEADIPETDRKFYLQILGWCTGENVDPRINSCGYGDSKKS
jgi:hypothetical protein